MQPTTYFVIGTNGVGKSETLLKLKELLPEDKYAVYDFDQRGVPDSAGKEWRKKEAHSWLMFGELNKHDEGKQTIVVGFVRPEEIEEVSKDLENKPVQILLDGNHATVTERIRRQFESEESVKRLLQTSGKTLEKYIADSIYYSELLHELRFVHNFKLINTNGRTPTEISADIMQFIYSGERGKGE